MIIVLFYIAFIVLTIALIVMSMIANHHLSDEIERLKDSFKYHKKIHKYERLMAEQKIKELIQLLDKLKESSNEE